MDDNPLVPSLPNWDMTDYRFPITNQQLLAPSSKKASAQLSKRSDFNAEHVNSLLKEKEFSQKTAKFIKSGPKQW